MKVTFGKAALADVLGVVSSVAPQRSTRPILYNAKVSVGGEGKAVFTATDLEVSVRWPVETLQASSAGEFLVPAGRALAIVREVTGEEVTFVAEGEHVTVEAGKARFRLNAAPTEEFPDMPTMPKNRVALEAGSLARMLDRTVFAVAREDFRYAINGVYILVEGGRLELTGSDGHRLANVKGKLSKKAKAGMEVIAPPKLMAEVQRAVAVIAKASGKGAADEGAEEGEAKVEVPKGIEAELAADEGQIFVKVGDVHLSGRQLEGTYPKYKEVIPKERAEKVGLARDALLAALRRVAVVTTEDTRSVVFEVEGGKMSLSAADPGVGSAEEEIEVEYKGKKRVTAFDPRLLSEGLKQMKEDAVGLEFEDDVEAAVVREGDYTYVIMPMRVRR